MNGEKRTRKIYFAAIADFTHKKALKIALFQYEKRGKMIFRFFFISIWFS